LNGKLSKQQEEHEQAQKALMEEREQRASMEKQLQNLKEDFDRVRYDSHQTNFHIETYYS